MRGKRWREGRKKEKKRKRKGEGGGEEEKKENKRRRPTSTCFSSPFENPPFLLWPHSTLYLRARRKASRFFVHFVDASLVHPLLLLFFFFKLFWTPKYPHFHCTSIPLPLPPFSLSLLPSVAEKNKEKKKRNSWKPLASLVENPFETRKPHPPTPLPSSVTNEFSQRTHPLSIYLLFSLTTDSKTRAITWRKKEARGTTYANPFLFTTITRVAGCCVRDRSKTIPRLLTVHIYVYTYFFFHRFVHPSRPFL